MSVRRPFRELTKDFTPERRKPVDAKKARCVQPSSHELRQAGAMTQKALGDRLKIVAEFPEREVTITNFCKSARKRTVRRYNKMV